MSPEWSTATQGEVHWLSLSSRMQRARRQAAILSFIVPLLMGFQMWQLYTGLAQNAGRHPDAAHLQALMDARRAMIGLGLILVAIPVVMTNSLRRMRIQLGTDGRQLFAKLATGELLTVSGEQLMYDGYLVAYGNHLFRINTPKGQPLYETQGVASHLASLLSRATRLTRNQMLRYRLTHREGALMGTLVIALLCIILLIITGPWRLLWSRLMVNFAS
jgi:hypothetical protein